MKNIFFIFISIVPLITLYAFIGLDTNSGDKDWNDCLEKYDTKWGEECNQCMYNNETFRVSLRNICWVKIDVMCCVQEKYKNWRCFSQNELAPQDTMFAYACKGNGKYLYWVKKAGDKQIIFPTIEEVNSKYNE